MIIYIYIYIYIILNSNIALTGISSSPSMVCLNVPSWFHEAGTILFNAASMSCRTSGSAFSFIVKLADVCCTNILHIPILICVISFDIVFWIWDVIKWQPLDGAVIEISCWNHLGVDIILLLSVAADADDSDVDDVDDVDDDDDGHVDDDDVDWAKEKGTAGTTKQVTTATFGSKSPRNKRETDFIAINGLRFTKYDDDDVNVRVMTEFQRLGISY
jgi:hypothetical protein